MRVTTNDGGHWVGLGGKKPRWVKYKRICVGTSKEVRVLTIPQARRLRDQLNRELAKASHPNPEPKEKPK